MGKHTQSIDYKVISRIYGKGRGWVFTPNNFKELGSRGAVDETLWRLKRTGTIKQLTRGLYLYPQSHPKLGILTPTAETIAKALAGRDATRLQPTGAYAANLLGLSDQIPMKIVFLTDGSSRSVLVGKQTIRLKRTTPKNMATAGKVSGLVIQALRYLGHHHVDEAIITKLGLRLTDQNKQQLLKSLIYAPGWIADVMRKIAGKKKA